VSAGLRQPGSERRTAADAAGQSRLSYDPETGQYTYVWKTDKAWAGACRVLAIQLVDATEHLLAFQFR
jgi:hypothetical protein